MNSIDHLFRGLGRFVFGLGVGFALTSAFVIVTNGPALEGRKAPASDVVRLDPVTVTISRERYAALQAEIEPPATPTAHVYGAGPLRV